MTRPLARPMAQIRPMAQARSEALPAGTTLSTAPA